MPPNSLDTYIDQNPVKQTEQPNPAPISSNPLDNYIDNQQPKAVTGSQAQSNSLDEYIQASKDLVPSHTPKNPALQQVVDKAQGTPTDDSILKRGWSHLAAGTAAAEALWGGIEHPNEKPKTDKSVWDKLQTTPTIIDPMPLTEDIHPESMVGKIALTGAKAMAQTWDAIVNPVNAGLFALSLAAPPLAAALGVGDKAVATAETLNKLAGAGLTANMMSKVMQMAPEFTKAVANGDTEKSIDLAAAMTTTSLFSVLGLRGTISDSLDPYASVKDKSIGEFNRINWIHTQEAYHFRQAFKKSVPDQQDRDAIQLLAEARVKQYNLAEASIDKYATVNQSHLNRFPVGDILKDWIDRANNGKVDPELRKQFVDAATKARDNDVSLNPYVNQLFDFYRTGKLRLTSEGLLGGFSTPDATPSQIIPSHGFKDENGNPDPLTMHTSDEGPKTLNLEETLALNRKDPQFAKLPLDEQVRRATIDVRNNAAQAKSLLDYLNQQPLEDTVKPDKDPQPSKILASDNRTPEDKTRELKTLEATYTEATNKVNKAEALWETAYRDWVKNRPPDEIYYPKELESVHQDYVKALTDLHDATVNYKNAKYSSGKVGEVHQLPDGNVVVYLHPEIMKELAVIHGAAPGVKLFGFNQGDIGSTLKGLANSPTIDDSTKNVLFGLLDTARKNMKEGRGVTVVDSDVRTRGVGNHVSTLREELLHGYQRSLSKGTMSTHLSEDDFHALYNSIPDKASTFFKRNGYSPNPVSYVVETAAWIMKGKVGWQDSLGLTADEASNWLYDYFQAVEKNHGEGSLNNIQHMHGLAKEVRARFTQAAKNIPEVGEKVNGETETIRKARAAAATGYSREPSDTGTVGGVQGEGPGRDTGSPEEIDKPWVARAPWQHEADEENELVRQARERLNVGTSAGERPNHLAKRVFESTIDGLEQGYKPVQRGFWYNQKYAFDASDIASDYHNSIGREIARKRFMDYVKNATGADGRPLVVPGGSINKIPNGPVQVNSNGIMDHFLTKDEVKTLTDSGKLQEYVKSGVIYQTKDGRYKFDTTGYSNDTRSRYAVNHRWVGTRNPSKAEMEDHFFDTGELGPEGSDILLKSPVAFHPEVADTARAVLDPKPGIISQYKAGRVALRISSELKQTLLSASGFHWAQIGGRAVTSGINPFNLDKWDLNNPEHNKLVQFGHLQPGIEGAGNMFTEGSGGEGGLLRHIPLLGDVLQKNNRALFGPNGYIDRAKLTAATDFVRRIKELHPDWDDEKTYALAGDLANNRFGGQNYLQLGRSKTAQDIARLTLLAPDWFESNMKDTALAVKYPQLGGKDFARIALYNFVVAQSINKAWTGQFHPEHPFEVVSPDGKKLYAVRTLPSDMVHMLGDPAEFFANRMNPTTVRTAAEAYVDIKQHKESLPQSTLDLFNNIVPIPGQGLAKQLEGDKSTDIVNSALTSFGITTRVYHTPAETLGLKLRSEAPGTTDMTDEQLHQMHKISELEDQLRKGDKSVIKTLQKGVRDGKYPPNVVNKVVKGANTDLIVSLTKGRSLDQAFDMWDLADNKEKMKMAPEMARKIHELNTVKGSEKYTSQELKQLYKRSQTFYEESKEAFEAERARKVNQPTPASTNLLDDYIQKSTKGSASTSYDEGPLAGQPVKGLLEKGNIDVNHRPSIANADGTHSSIFSATIALDNNDNVWEGKYEDAPKYALIPQIANGKFLTSDGKMPTTLEGKRQLEEASIKYYEKTHEHLGIFSSSKAADDYTANHAYMNDGTDRKVYAPSTTSQQ